MNTLEITQCLKKDPYAKAIFKQVVPRDKLPNVPRLGYPSAFVINTQPSNMRGEHWLAVYYDKQGFCTFFDSYGMRPSFYNLYLQILYFKHHVVLNTIHSNYKVSRRVCVAIIAFTSLCSKLADSVYMRL